MLSLYIPLNETINNCVSDLHNKNLYNGKLSKRDLFKLLEIATSEFSFIFDYLLYKNIEEVAVGSPLGLTLANLFICHYEQLWMDNCLNYFKPMIYKRYLFQFKEHLQHFVDYMKKQHKCLKLTSEAEISMEIVFTSAIKESILNCQISSLKLIKSGAPQGLVLGPLLFRIYINGLLDNILYTCKILADNTSLFSHVFDKCKSQNVLNNAYKL